MSLKSLKQVLPPSVRDRYRGRWNRLQRFFISPPFPKNEDGKVYVHLGCGPIDHPKFINVDAIPLKHIHYVQAVERLQMFKDGTVDLIYTCHCLEHISYLDVPKVLKEWHRALKPGGILRISVPDFSHILKIYHDFDDRMDAIESALLGGQNYEFNYHKSAYNKKHLEGLLAKTGFTNIQEWIPGSSDLTTFKDWSGRKINIFDKKYPISLNLEGEKAR